MILTLPSYAKINWTLEILGRRPDGYHELRTLLQTVDLADTLQFTLIEEGIEIDCDHPEVPRDERNLVHRAARLLLEQTGVRRGVRIGITKRIPTAAGLGGGSSNAAVTLLALDHLWGLGLPVRDLFRLGSRLGADVPFFLIGGTCLGVGRGDEVYPVAAIEAPYLLLVNGGILVPTGEVYANLPDELTNPGGVVKMPLSLEVAYATIRRQRQSRLRSPDWNAPGPDWEDWLRNDLELPVLPRHPRLAAVRQQLLDLGARASLLSGSGSTVFAVFDNDQIRHEAATRLREAGWWCAPVRTIGYDDCQAVFSGLADNASQ